MIIPDLWSQKSTLWGPLALVCFVLSLAVHIAASFDIHVYSRVPFVGLLHLASLGLFGLSLLDGGYRLSSDDVSSRFPGWIRAAGAAVVIYAVVNTVVFAGRLGEGNADLRQGQYILMSHGRVLAHISEREYHLHRAYELRVYSGVWLAFCLFSTVYFLVRPRVRDTH